MVSVIIPTLNRAGLLEKTLASIARQTIGPDRFEVIVVDNGSVDHTRVVIEKAAATLPNLQYIFEKKPGLHEGRHCGLRAAKHDLLTFADDDIEALPTWIEGIQESFGEDPRIGIVGGKNIPWYESTPPEWIDNLWENVPEGEYITHFSLLDFGDIAKDVHPRYVFGCNFSIRKDLLIQSGGFHPDGMPPDLLKYRGDGETYVAQRIEEMGYRTRYNPKASVKHWVPASRMTTEYMKKRAFAEGVSQSYIDTRKKALGQLSWKERLTKWGREKIGRQAGGPMFREMRESFEQGYQFHQQALKDDKDLLAWVLKESYL